MGCIVHWFISTDPLQGEPFSGGTNAPTHGDGTAGWLWSRKKRNPGLNIASKGKEKVMEVVPRHGDFRDQRRIGIESCITTKKDAIGGSVDIVDIKFITCQKTILPALPLVQLWLWSVACAPGRADCQLVSSKKRCA